MKTIKICKFCKKEFTPNSNRQLYCTRSCKDKAYWRRKNPIKEKICLFCNEPFIPKHNNSKFCSKEHSRYYHQDKTRELMNKLRKEFPELYLNNIGSKNTNTSYSLKRDKKGEPDFEKEARIIRNERKRLGI